MSEYRSIELNLLVGCPVKCHYCPQSSFLSSYKGKERYLNEENLLHILKNSYHNYNNKLEVYFAGFSEPLAAKNCLSLLEVCEKDDNIGKIVLFTTGYKLTEDQLVDLSEMKKLKVNFHVGDLDLMPFFDKDIWNKLDLIKLKLKKFDFLEVGFSKNSFKDINKLLESKGIKYKFQKIINRAGNLKKVDDIQLQEIAFDYPVTCSKMTFEKRPVILPDGTTLACTNDYGCEMIIGNLISDKWEDLDFEKIIKLQNDYKSNLPCFKGCHFAKKKLNLKHF